MNGCIPGPGTIGPVAERFVVVGAGTMGVGIAYVACGAGYRTEIVEIDAERRHAAVASIRSRYRDAVSRGRLADSAAEEAIGLMSAVGVLDEVPPNPDVVVEAVPERLDLKRDVLAAAEALGPGLLGTNTSSIPIRELATGLAHPERLIGLHFFNPVSRMMLVEVVSGGQTRESLSAPAAALVRQLDKLPLPVASAPGFLVNRILAPYLMEAMRCVDEGIAAEAVDEAALEFGMPMGPIELADTVGLDICLAVGRMLGPDVAPPRKLSELIAAGHLGRKTGRGFYDWSNGKAAKSAPGTVPAGLSKRLIDPLLAEARAALGQHIVADADLLDAGAVFGFGFAPFTGGPMQYLADHRAGS